ncbi:hypothetical protein M8C21_028252 [Ambrosia artemisiifolia]|uniref:Transcription elongation factor Eaf N-terminal domain-containing protein n=1 Tax=Ambrosia artemisiifolia TaxID=4212 RepID=A0AAD5CXD1_AMBAR|nr:hypothetical protein M8C21_028252 [Ambrosia artemisiifolia]
MASNAGELIHEAALAISYDASNEFKPASIDKNQPGKLHKSKDNKVAVEFQNNQPWKPKVSFDGSIEDYKDNDAVLFFDGTSFRTSGGCPSGKFDKFVN